MTRERLKALLSEYGRVAIYTYLALFVVVLAGFTLAIAWGVDVESTHGGAGALGAAYLATKATQPLRIAATLGLTPLVAAALKKLGWVREPQPSEPRAEPPTPESQNEKPQP